MGFYADDTVIYCAGPFIAEALAKLQDVFNIIQIQLSQLKLVLNVDKTKVMHFSNASKKPENTVDIISAQGKKLEVVSSFKYLGIWLDDGLSFKHHVENLLKKLRLKLGFYFRNKSCFSVEARKRLISATF